jgi:hypothetical protein
VEHSSPTEEALVEYSDTRRRNESVTIVDILVQKSSLGLEYSTMRMKKARKKGNEEKTFLFPYL